ncbi:hypothetical protein [Methylobacterium nodulans]|uniref:Uncharacterized protein n=1 Tax=Methylobacterium nodulans (strain LMG 21967 / CNCM I-2342 / ORS 2060) TaxID=460265 RepID=B8IX39_METNO|nr:hypothetical protein [Methylobacterium nodulans]ACL63080.1 conserved hypothetical protein [Methylobacterium nodulans ORS 2060]
MTKALLLAGTLVATASGYAWAQQTFTAWGHTFTVSEFAPQQMMVAVATDTKTGRKFNVLKLKNGKMMAVAPINSMRGMPETSQEDMIQ